MTTETSQQEEAKRIWDQLDSEVEANASAEQTNDPANATESTAEQAAEQVQMQEAAEAKPEAVQDEDPKALRDKIAGLEAMLTQLSGRVRNTEGHIGGLTSQIKAQVEAAKAVQNSGGDAPTAKEIREAQGDPEALKRLTEDYPEFAKALAPAIDAVVSERMAKIETKFQQDNDKPNPLSEIEKLRTELKLERIEAKHPGWQLEVENSKAELAGWLQRQPREVQMLAASQEPADAVRFLDLWKESRRPQATNQTRGIAAAAALPTGRQSGARQKSVDQMTHQELWAYYDQMDKRKG
jgi:hypothetical protein